MRQSLMFSPDYTEVAPCVDKKGVVYTKPWVVQLLLNLAHFYPERNLVDSLLVEPSAGEGAFLVPIIERLVESCQNQGRPLIDCKHSLIAYEVDPISAEKARHMVRQTLLRIGSTVEISNLLALAWVRTGDYLLESINLPRADYVVGNPPYVRSEEIPEMVAGHYRQWFPTMRGRADLYIGFYEAALRSLKPGGVCAFICADRWMLNQYGAELRALVTSGFSVETIIEMHEASAFEDDVSAYPAITVLRCESQSRTVVAKAGFEAELVGYKALTDSIEAGRNGVEKRISGLTQTIVDSWFQGSDPWPCSSPRRMALLRRLEDTFGLLESEKTGTKVGIGVATGADRIFITKDLGLVEETRLVPLALAKDTISGHLKWSGHFLVDPWNGEGLVDLCQFPKLRSYFESHQELVRNRNTAQKNPAGWYRTIDRVSHALIKKPKLYIPDIKNQLNPVLDSGETYPHHNLYFIQSDNWDLEVLGGILLSAVGQFFVECYGVRMRGGYLRFQAQYLRRIRLPEPSTISASDQAELVHSFRTRDRQLATKVALKLYQIEPAELEESLGS